MSWNSLNRFLFDSTPLVLSLLAWPPKSRLRASCHYSIKPLHRWIFTNVCQASRATHGHENPSKMVIGCFSISAEQSEYSRYSKYTGNRCFLVCELSKSCRLLILLPWHLVDFFHYKRYIQKKSKVGLGPASHQDSSGPSSSSARYTANTTRKGLRDGRFSPFSSWHLHRKGWSRYLKNHYWRQKREKVK